MKWLKRISLALVVLLGVGLVTLTVLMRYTASCPSPITATSNDKQMSAAIARCYGGPEIISIEQTALPEVGENDLLIQVKAAAVNPLDWHYMRGSPYFIRLFAGIGAPSDPRMGVDFSGTVVAAGKDVKNYAIGDAVFGGRNGAFAQYLVIPEDKAVAMKPENVSFAQAAAVPIAAITALQAVRDKGQIKAGDKVLINGASGGVGSFAVQIAKALGAEVTGVSSTRNIERVLSIGADHMIDYKTQNYPELPQRYDVIVDMVGNHSVLTNQKVLTAGGKLVIVGGKKGNWIAPLMGPISTTLLNPFYDEEFISFTAVMKPDDLATLAQMMADGAISPLIDRYYPLEQAAEALGHSETGRAQGKIILDIDGAREH